MTTATDPTPVLHNYWRSSTSFRVRIALALKGVGYEYVAYHLRKGEQRSDRYLALNPLGLVPSLAWTDGRIYTQSLAIIEFLEETVPAPPLLPKKPAARARVREIAQTLALEIHPINNLRVLNELRSMFGADDAGVTAWYRHWVREAFEPLEHQLAHEPETGRFCHGDTVTMADICLVPQVAGNARFGIDMGAYPTIQRIYDSCMAEAAFQKAAPAQQPDAE